jgi:Tfp pilus assembly protein PilN
MIEFNLLPDIKQQYLKAKRLKKIIIFIVVVISTLSLVLFAFSYWYVYFNQKNNIKNLNNEITSSIRHIKSNPNLNKILTIQNQLNSLPNILSQSPKVSRIFNFMAELTPANATISDLTINLSSNSISINGGADSLNTVNQFVDTLKYAKYNNGSSKNNAPFSSVTLASFSYSSSASSTTPAQFTITFNYDPTLFNNTDNIQLVVPNITTTRSILNQPKILFQSNTKG